MPTYAYRCTACSHEFTIVQKMSDDPVKVCPECGGAVVRLLAPVGIVFKGSGWYVNDSRKPDTSDVAPPSETASAAEGKGAAADSKPDGAKPAAEAPAGKGETSTSPAADASKADRDAKSRT